MAAELFWIPGPWQGRLAISSRPRGGDWLEDEVRAWHRASVQIVVSLLEPPETAELGLEQEGALVESAGLRFVSFPIPDRGLPASRSMAAFLVQSLTRDLAGGRNVAVHCRQVGRSALVAAAALIVAGMDAASALRTVSTARRLEVPETAEQRRWIERLPGDRAPVTRR